MYQTAKMPDVSIKTSGISHSRRRLRFAAKNVPIFYRQTKPEILLNTKYEIRNISDSQIIFVRKIFLDSVK